MKHYQYNGPVIYGYGVVHTPNWSGETYANTKGRALSNIKYRYKKEHGLVQSTKIVFTNDIMEV